jgi:hypothetical protein
MVVVLMQGAGQVLLSLTPMQRFAWAQGSGLKRTEDALGS